MSCRTGPQVEWDAVSIAPFPTGFFTNLTRQWRSRTSVLLTSLPLPPLVSANLAGVRRRVVILPTHGLEVRQDRSVELPQLDSSVIDRWLIRRRRGDIPQGLSAARP